MPEYGFSFFLWMTMGFTILYLLVLSALTTQPKKQPVIVNTIRDVRRRKRKRALLVANAAARKETRHEIDERADRRGHSSGKAESNH